MHEKHPNENEVQKRSVEAGIRKGCLTIGTRTRQQKLQRRNVPWTLNYGKKFARVE
jgi:hypothetical protein